MLPKGLISKIIEYYLSNPDFSADIQCALLDFFKLDETGKTSTVERNDTTEGLFNEWLLYDFRLHNGKTPLEDFCENNPCGLPDNEIDLCRQLRATQQYGFFEVKEVELDKGLKLYNLCTGEMYDVEERSATHFLKPGFILYHRVALINHHWELVGGDSPCLPMQLTERMRKSFRKNSKEKLSPRETCCLFSNKNQKDINTPKLNPAEARARLEKLLESTGLKKFVSVETIVSWCQRKGKINKIFEVASLIFGLADHSIDSKSSNRLLRALQDVYNTAPQKKLSDKSPQEKSAGNPNRIPKIIADIQVMGGEKWLKKLEKAHNYMEEGDYKQAAKTFGEVFSALLEEKTTRADIYRLYANKAVSHFAIGERNLGKKMLELALDLNPNYDFAQKLKKEYERGDYDRAILQAHLQTIDDQKKTGKKVSRKNLFHTFQKIIKNDPAVQYYEYVKRLGINFATTELTTSKLTTFKHAKVGRNDPCPCGATYVDGHPIKYKHCHGR